jgi:hypothetical protein
MDMRRVPDGSVRRGLTPPPLCRKAAGGAGQAIFMASPQFGPIALAERGDAGTNATKGRQMERQSKFDVREVVRVLFSGMTAYVAVALVIQPQIIAAGVSPPVFVAVSLLGTVLISVAFGYILSPRRRDEARRAAAAQLEAAPQVTGRRA